jgi:hypothetical protein
VGDVDDVVASEAPETVGLDRLRGRLHLLKQPVDRGVAIGGRRRSARVTRVRESWLRISAAFWVLLSPSKSRRKAPTVGLGSPFSSASAA